MTPIYLEFTHRACEWSALLHPDQGRCDLWRDQVYAGTVTFSRSGGFSVSAAQLREVMPTLADQLAAYSPLLRHEGLIATPSEGLAILAASA